MIQITDLLTGENFDLPKDFKISIEETNPLLSEQGSVSLPINLPYTRKNVRLTGFMHRIDKAKKYVTKRDIVISAGIFIKKGTLVITSAQKNAALTGVVLIGESQLYSKMKDVLMTEIFKDEVRDDFSGTTSEKIEQWIDYLNRLMFDDNLDNEISIFPVAIKDGKMRISMRRFAISVYTYSLYGYFNFINHVAVSYNYKDNESGQVVNVPAKYYYDSEGNILGYRLSAQEEITALDSDSGTLITYPVGYAVSPFLKLNYVLRTIFNHFGFNLVQDDYFEQCMHQLVILNNNIDSIMFGSIYYAQLVPTCTVSEFLKSICNKFGFEFILDPNGVDVLIRSWNKTLTPENIFSLDDCLSSHPSVVFEQPKQLKLSRNYPELIHPPKYPSHRQLDVKYPEIQDGYSEGVEVFWDDVIQTIMERHELSNDSISVYISIGEYAFDFYKEKEGYEIFEIKSEETFVEMIISDMASCLRKSHSIHKFCATPYIPTVRTLNTYIQMENSVKKNDEGKCPIMFCYSAGRYDIEDNNLIESDENLTYGTTYSQDNSQPTDLNYFRDSGTYEACWKKLDMMLQNSFHEIKLQLHMPIEKLQKLLEFNSVNLKGQPLLPESVKYEISNESIKIIEAKFRTIKSYE